MFEIERNRDGNRQKVYMEPYKDPLSGGFNNFIGHVCKFLQNSEPEEPELQSKSTETDSEI